MADDGRIYCTKSACWEGLPAKGLAWCYGLELDAQTMLDVFHTRLEV